jgi:hypothetical protein
MNHLKLQLRKFLMVSLGFFLALPPSVLAQNTPRDSFSDARSVPEYQAESISPEEIESLNYIYTREQFSLQYYSSLSDSMGGEEKLLFQKVKEENQMHINTLEDLYQTHSLPGPSEVPERDAFYSEILQRNRNLEESLRASIELEQREVAELTRAIERVRDREMQNFLNYLRIESYLHLCEMFIFSEISQISVALNTHDAEACRNITALEKLPEDERRMTEPRSFNESSLVVDRSGVLLVQNVYQPGNALDYGAFYQGYGYRYLNPTPFYGCGGYGGGGYGGGCGGYGGYPGGGYGGYPGGGYGGYPGYPGGGGGYPGVPRTPYFPGTPYSGGHGNNFFDFNFYFHNPYDSGFNYGSYPFPGGYGGRY